MKCGIYLIVNTLTWKYYAGSTTNFNRRCAYHQSKLNNNIHENKHLQQAWNKYGEQNFMFWFAEYVDPENLLIVEQTYIDSNFDENIPLGYNEAKFAVAPARGRKTSEETKRKLSVAMSGKLFSQNHKKKLKDNHAKFWLGKKFDNEVKIKMSRSKFGKGKGYYLDKRCNLWHVRLQLNKIPYSGGYFKSEIEAQEAVIKLKIELEQKEAD